MGESSRLETAITVTGLKPGHFYNVRVIAVGPNNFQAGSSVIRLQTQRRDARLQLPNGQVSSNPPDQQGDTLADDSDELSAGYGKAAGVEAAAIDTPTLSRDQTSGGAAGQRRNTGGRRHSPSNAAVEQAAISRRTAQQPEESMQQLTVRFDAVRKEIAEVATQSSKDLIDHNSQKDELAKERERVKRAVEEKEKASEILKKEVHTSERANRQAQTRKAQKEKILRDKRAERAKMQDDMVRWRNEIADMGAERETWLNEKEKMAIAKETKSMELHVTILDRQASVSALEEDIRIRGLQIKELEEERKHLPGGQDDEESRERDEAAAQRDVEWDIKEKGLSAALHDRALYLRQLEAEYHQLYPQWQAITARHQPPLMYHANSSGIDFDPSGGQGKATSRRSRHRKSRTSTVSSQAATYLPPIDSPFPGAGIYNNLNNTASPSFAPGPYFDLRNDNDAIPFSEQMVDMTEAERLALTAGAQLSPTATSLLPSNIFEGDDEPPSPRTGSPRSFGPALYGLSGPANETDQQSPGSSSRSASLMSSPQTSSHNLAMYGVTLRDYGVDSDRRSLKNSPRGESGTLESPRAPDQPPSFKGLTNIFTFPRARGKTMQGVGPALGSLKQGQSQSFPRSMEEPEIITNRARRISFSSGWSVPSLFNRNSTTGDTTDGNAPAPARNPGARRRRAFNVFGSSMDDQSAGFPDRDPSSPRPLSIASSDLPRPSTDSAPFGWPAAEGNVINRNSRLATDWSTNMRQTWSSRSSRRPSMQHGSTTALHNGLASADDEILLPDTLLGQSSPPGVIGTRPPSSHKPVTPRLNPAAPTFKLFSRSSKAEKGKANEKASEASTTGDDSVLATNLSSPAESRKSRDTPSIHTQASMAESHDSLERTSSNTYSDMASASATSAKEKESSFRQLLRKGSSSKFSLSSIRGKDSSFFGGKKGPSSATHSDRNASVERDASFDEFGEDELGRSVESASNSPMIGSLSSSEWKGRDSQAGNPKEGRMWSRFGLKGNKSKPRESLDVERSETSETTGTEDEGMF